MKYIKGTMIPLVGGTGAFRPPGSAITERGWNQMSGCIFPPCPKCDKGHMIPYSMGHDVFELWKCTNCTHIVYKKS